MAFKLDVKDGKPVPWPYWRSRDMKIPEPPIVGNGVVFAASSGENTRQAVDVEGARHHFSWQRDALRARLRDGQGAIFQRQDDAGYTHFSGLATREGCVYVVTHGVPL